MGRECAAQRLAVQADCRQGLRRRIQIQRIGRPPAQHVLEHVRVQRHQQVAKAIPRRRLAGEPQQMPDLDRMGMQPVRNRRISPNTAQNGTNNRGQHGRQSMASSLAPAWVRNLRQIRQQAPRGSRIQNASSFKPD